MAAEEAAARAEEEAETFLGPLPPDIIAEAEQAGANKPTAEVLRICRCSCVLDIVILAVHWSCLPWKCWLHLWLDAVGWPAPSTVSCWTSEWLSFIL